jgi:FtsP/CotA-like multicopper oxidase with cupredoxin domain
MPPTAPTLSRRRLLAGAGLACLALPASAGAQADGFRVLRARAQENSPIWSFDGAVPGPTLRLKQGEELRVRLVNDLPEPTTIHWHGVRVPNAMDGVPGLTQAPVAPGASFDYRFRAPDAGTFCYYAPSQLDRGLSGALIVEEAQPVGVDREIVLVLAMPHAPGGAGGSVLVNGSLHPDVPVKAGERLRLRLVNATRSRGLAIRIDGHSAWVMAIDGQPAEPFLARDRVALAPGGRIDLFVDARREPGASSPLLAGFRDEHTIAQLVYDNAGPARATLRPDPIPLPENPLPARIDLKASLKVELALGSAKALDPAAPPLFTVRRGRAVTLTLRNRTGHLHAVHLHGHHFRLLDRLDDGWKPYWLDTLVVGDQVERIAFVAANPGKWLIHGRRLEQTDADTAVWFAVS